MDFETVANELYGLAPEDFVAERTKREKQARSEGERDLAARIHRLAKPTVVAWLANQLVRNHPEEIGPLLELGADLREATATLSGEDLRRLSQQQHQVIRILIQQAAQLAREAGKQLTDATSRGLEETLRAALADGELADQLATGRLSGGLEHVGFSTAGGAAPTAAVPRPKAAADQQTRQRLQREVRQAQEAVQSAQATRRQTKATLDQANTTLVDRVRTLARLQRELDEARRENAGAEKDEAAARAAYEDAGAALQTAQDELHAAQHALDATAEGGS